MSMYVCKGTVLANAIPSKPPSLVSKFCSNDKRVDNEFQEMRGVCRSNSLYASLTSNQVKSRFVSISTPQLLRQWMDWYWNFQERAEKWALTGGFEYPFWWRSATPPQSSRPESINGCYNAAKSRWRSLDYYFLDHFQTEISLFDTNTQHSPRWFNSILSIGQVRLLSCACPEES